MPLLFAHISSVPIRHNSYADLGGGVTVNPGVNGRF